MRTLKYSESELRDLIIKYWNENVTQRDMAKIMHVSRDTIQLRVDRLLQEGKIKERNKKREAHAKRSMAQRQMYAAQIRDMYLKGMSITDISKEVAIPLTTVSRYVAQEKALGNIPATPAKEKKIFVSPEKQNVKTVPSTLAPGETVKCDRKISSQCVYGVALEQQSAHGHLCRYESVTKRCRSMICPHEACTCFSKVSKNNPRLKGTGDDDER